MFIIWFCECENSNNSCYCMARIVVPWQCAVVLLFSCMYVVMCRLGPTGCNSSIS